MGNNTCLVLTGRVIRIKVRNREYARLSLRESRKLLDYVGRDVTVIVIINSNNEGVGNEPG
jgi:hypothetical protein